MKIQKLSNSTHHEDKDLAAKINEIIDVVNKILEMQPSGYITPEPSPYDLNAIGKILKPRRK